MVRFASKTLLLSGFALGLFGCPSQGPGLSVEVRTDFVGGAEFSAARSEVFGTAVTDRPIATGTTAAFGGEDWFHPHRVQEVPELTPGEHAIRVSLLRTDGTTLVSRVVVTTVRARTSVLVVLTRDCAGVACPGAAGDPRLTTCFGGRCVDPHCTAEGVDSCPMPECAASTECPGAPVACAIPACVEGACLYDGTSRCAAAEYCDFARGCRPLGVLDSGVPDVGAIDSGALDQGVRDAAVDAGPPDSGPSCVPGASCDTGNPCALGQIGCTGNVPRCDVMGPAPASTECHASTGPCDPAETCGGATTCPSDALATAGVPCRVSTGVCDAAEVCTGSSAACPADLPIPDGGACPTGVCSSGSCVPCSSGLPCSTGLVCQRGTLDCSSGSAVCNAAGPVSAGVSCRASAGPCDVLEACDGTSSACPPDVMLTGSTVCRGTVGPCDVAEVCGSAGAACPADLVLPSGAMCRGSAGGCDVPETCSGASSTCPGDLLLPGGSSCRAAAGVCDAEETCSGSSATCPSDGRVAAGTPCRGSAGLCDQVEVCTGSSNACPGDAFLPAGTACRAGGDVCNPGESCSGASASCPMDLVAPNGTACGSEMCGSFGACTGTGCDLTAGTQSSLCSTPACSGGSCSGATNRSMMRGCTRSASCPDACCNALELSDTCGADCTAPVGITFGSRVVTPIIGNPFGIPFDDTCPADMLAQYFSVDYQAEWLRGMWTYCASVSYAPNHAPDPPTYSIAYNGLAFTLPTRGGMGWTTWNCPADQVITGYTGAVTSYMGRSVVDAIELHCSRITMNGRTFPGATFTITTGSSVLVDDPFPPPTTPTLGPYDCPAGMAVHGFVGSYSDGITGPGSPGALESFGMICAPIAPR